MRWIKVNLKSPIAEVEGTMNELPNRVLQAQGHDCWGQDRYSDEHVDKVGHTKSLGHLPLHHHHIPRQFKSCFYVQKKIFTPPF